MNTYKLFLFSILLSVGLVSCSDEDNDIPQPQTAQMSVSLIDAPGDYEAVFVDVVDVMVKIDEEDPEGGDGSEWQSLGGIQADVYDLLSLTAGVSQLLAESEVPPGHLTDMRLVLGTNNTIIIDGTPYPLATPSAQQSGLKLKVDHQLEAGEEYAFVLDFNVDESIVEASESDQYILKPVLRLFLETETGSISGTVPQNDAQYLIVATNGTTTVSTYPNEEGKYMLQGLSAGTYTVVFTPEAGLELPIATFNDIEVEVGQTTTLNLE